MLPSAACRAPLPSMNCATNKSLEPSLLARTAPQLATNGTGLFSDWDYCSGVLVLRSGSDPAACYCGGRNGKRGPKGGMIGPARLGLRRDCWSLTDRPTRPYGSRSVTLGVLTPIWDAVTCGVPKPGHGICPAFLWAGFVLVDEPVGEVPDFWKPHRCSSGDDRPGLGPARSLATETCGYALLAVHRPEDSTVPRCLGWWSLKSKGRGKRSQPGFVGSQVVRLVGAVVGPKVGGVTRAVLVGQVGVGDVATVRSRRHLVREVVAVVF
jgi:hypothetical protein